MQFMGNCHTSLCLSECPGYIRMYLGWSQQKKSPKKPTWEHHLPGLGKCHRLWCGYDHYEYHVPRQIMHIVMYIYILYYHVQKCYYRFTIVHISYIYIYVYPLYICHIYTTLPIHPWLLTASLSHVRLCGEVDPVSSRSWKTSNPHWQSLMNTWQCLFTITYWYIYNII